MRESELVFAPARLMTAPSSSAAEPWTINPDWIDPRGIPQDVNPWRRTLLYFFGVIFLGLGALLLISLLGSPASLGAWLWFVGVAGMGAVMFVAAKRKPSAKEEAQLARFIPMERPIPLGGELAGMIIVPRPIVPTAPGRVTLSCWHRELYERNSDRNGPSESERKQLMGDTAERLVQPAEWSRTDARSELIVQLPVRGDRESTPTPLKVGNPVDDWVLGLRMPVTGGTLDLEFSVPVFRVPGVSPEQRPAPPTPAKVTLEDVVVEVAAALEPPVIAGAPADERACAMAAGGVRLDPQPGATGGTAIVLDAAAAQSSQQLAWIGVVIALFLEAGLGLFGLFLFMIPYVGWLFALAVIGLAGWMAWTTLRSVASNTANVDRLWVENDAVVGGTVAGPAWRVGRSEIDRFEVVPFGSVGERQIFGIFAAAAPLPGERRRKRHELAHAVYTRAAAHAIAQWLGERLGSPRAPVVDRERGIELLERGMSWYEKRRARSRT